MIKAAKSQGGTFSVEHKTSWPLYCHSQISIAAWEIWLSMTRWQANRTSRASPCVGEQAVTKEERQSITTPLWSLRTTAMAALWPPLFITTSQLAFTHPLCGPAHCFVGGSRFTCLPWVFPGYPCFPKFRPSNHSSVQSIPRIHRRIEYSHFATPKSTKRKR